MRVLIRRSLSVRDDGPSKPGVPRSSRAIRLACPSAHRCSARSWRAIVIRPALSLSKGGRASLRKASACYLPRLASARLRQSPPSCAWSPGSFRLRAKRYGETSTKLEERSRADPADRSHRSPFASNVPGTDGIVMADGRGRAVGSTVRAQDDSDQPQSLSSGMRRRAWRRARDISRLGLGATVAANRRRPPRRGAHFEAPNASAVAPAPSGQRTPRACAHLARSGT